MYVDLDTGTIVGDNIIYVPEIPEEIAEGSDSDIIEWASAFKPNGLPC